MSPNPKPDPLAFSPFAGLVHPSKRPRLPKLDSDDDVRRLDPLSVLEAPTKTKPKAPKVPATWLGNQRKKQ